MGGVMLSIRRRSRAFVFHHKRVRVVLTGLIEDLEGGIRSRVVLHVPRVVY
jgi:hypothetical protein